MAIGRYFQPTAYEGQLYTPPIDIIAGALEKAQKQYDTNFLLTEKLRNKYIEALPQDRARANQLQQEFEKEIDATVAKYNGDYGAATSDLYKLTSKMTKAFSPGGEAYSIQGNYSTVQESLKRERERLAKGEVTSDQVNLLQEYYYGQAPTTFNKETQGYSTINQLDLAKYVDEGKIAEEILTKLPTRKKKQDVFAGLAPNGDYLYRTEEVEWKDPHEAVVALDQGLFSNDAYMGYTSQIAQLAGVDPNEYQRTARQQFIQNVVPARTGVMHMSSTNKFVDNWRERKRVDLSNSIALENYKQKNRKELEAIRNGAESLNKAPSLLAIQQGADDTLPDLPKTYTDGPSNPILKFLAGPRPEKNVSVNQLIKDHEEGKQLPYSVNVAMLKSIKAANPNLPDSAIIDLYNTNKNTASHRYGEIHMDRYETSSTQREEAKRLLPLLSAGRTKIQVVDPDTGKVRELDSTERLDLANDLQKAAKEKSPNFAALGKSRTASGKVFYGTVLADPNGGRKFYVVKESRADIEAVQDQVLDKAFKFLQDGTRQIGEVFTLNMNGQDIPIMGYKRYLNGQMTPEYYVAKRDSRGGFVPDLENKDALLTNTDRYGRQYPIGPTELEKLILDQQTVFSTFARESKSKYENELNEQD